MLWFEVLQTTKGPTLLASSSDSLRTERFFLSWVSGYCLCAGSDGDGFCQFLVLLNEADSFLVGVKDWGQPCIKHIADGNEEDPNGCLSDDWDRRAACLPLPVVGNRGSDAEPRWPQFGIQPHQVSSPQCRCLANCTREQDWLLGKIMGIVLV
jgi:hypothetical protein